MLKLDVELGEDVYVVAQKAMTQAQKEKTSIIVGCAGQIVFSLPVNPYEKDIEMIVHRYLNVIEEDNRIAERREEPGYSTTNVFLRERRSGTDRRGAISQDQCAA